MAFNCPKILCLTCKNCKGIEVNEHFGTFYCKCERDSKFDTFKDSVSPKIECRYYESEVEA